MVVARSQGCKAHIPGVDHVLKKPYVSNCCYRENGDFNPTYHDWLEREREREREREMGVMYVSEE